jgi:hypothetical protein
MLKSTFVILLVIVLASSSNVVAQSCWQSFSTFIVTDSVGRKVSNVTIELLKGLSDEKRKDLWEIYGNKEPGFQPNPFKIPVVVAEEIIKQNLPLSRSEDFCGNPLKQTAGKTKVKTWNDKLHDRDGKKENFGFCKHENGGESYLLKISPPGYITEYYIGSYLRGCNGAWYFVVTKR